MVIILNLKTSQLETLFMTRKNERRHEGKKKPNVLDSRFTPQVAAKWGETCYDRIGVPRDYESAQDQPVGIHWSRRASTWHVPVQCWVHPTGSAPAAAAASRSARPRGGWSSHHASSSVSTRVARARPAPASAIPTEPHAPKAKPGEPKKGAKGNEAPLLPRERRTRTQRRGAAARHQWRPPPPSPSSSAAPPKQSA